MSETTAPTQRRAGERSARRALRRAPNSEMLPGLTNTLPVCDVMDSAQVEHIDVASMDILENVGGVFRDNIALADWKAAGAKVVGEMMFPNRGLVRDLIAPIPSSFTAWRKGCNGTALTKLWRPCQALAPAGTALGIRTLKRIFNRSTSCPKCSTTTRSINGRRKGLSRLRSGP